jgi:hypothetical protein
MGLAVCDLAICQCSFGLTPSILKVPPDNGLLVLGLPVASTQNHIPLVNVLPFIMCNSSQNPLVIAATAAALGVLTPMPCIPMTQDPWTSEQTKLTLKDGAPALDASAKLNCMWGGSISIVFPGQIFFTL